MFPFYITFYLSYKLALYSNISILQTVVRAYRLNSITKYMLEISFLKVFFSIIFEEAEQTSLIKYRALYKSISLGTQRCPEYSSRLPAIDQLNY